MPTSLQTLPASSSIVLEVSKNGEVRGFLNDEEYDLGGCKPNAACSRSEFKGHLMSAVKKIPNVTEFCKKTEFDTNVLN